MPNSDIFLSAVLFIKDNAGPQTSPQADVLLFCFALFFGGFDKLYTHPVSLEPMTSPFTPFMGEEVSFELELTSVLLG